MTEMTPPDDPAVNHLAAPSPGRRGWGWIGYFALLAVLAVAAITINIVYNLSQQLKPAQLAAARALWKAKGPRDYDLEYTQKGSDPGTFVARIRQGRTIAVTLDGRALEKRLFVYYDMPALFDYIERFLEIDREPGKPRTYTRALFDANDGHVVYYLRSVMATKERVEWTVQLKRVADPSGKEEKGD